MARERKTSPKITLPAAAQTGIRFTDSDRELLAWLQEQTGVVSVTELVRMGLRALKREQERK
ncbi:MAG: hypothetical protein KGL39_18425 [Patescibacteria group bacterium]|nr:hypothetical protein [Patescibacteria group bacterium]